MPAIWGARERANSCSDVESICGEKYQIDDTFRATSRLLRQLRDFLV